MFVQSREKFTKLKFDDVIKINFAKVSLSDLPTSLKMIRYILEPNNSNGAIHKYSCDTGLIPIIITIYLLPLLLP
jgi:hypothetical protein